MLILGIMSGTSLDGVDYALCDVRPGSIVLKRLWQARFPGRLQERLSKAATGLAMSHEVGQLHHDLGRFYAAEAVRGLRDARPRAVGLHGQTVFHQPMAPDSATFQIGEPAWLVEALRAPVVSNFRAADLAAGGQGAPLASAFHQLVFGRRGEFVCVNNLGGISNVTAIDWRRTRQPRLLAFDTGPANVLLDIAVRHFSGGRRRIDRGGVSAARGQANEALLGRWLRHPFFRCAPPKSTGSEMFGKAFWAAAWPAISAEDLQPLDTLATLTAFTARSIALNYRLHLRGKPDRVVLAGGGVANRTLVQWISAELAAWHPQVQVFTSDQLGWPPQSVEPAAFALLAWRRLHGLPGNEPATTGARRHTLLGQLSQGVSPYDPQVIDPEWRLDKP
jgi:anhydro-N-acetylmuramic acid kinase